MKPYYERDGITLYHGDCRDVLPELTDSVQIVVTDPPYNAKKNYGSGTDDDRPWLEWVEWIDSIWDVLLPMSRDGILAFLSLTAYKQVVRHSRHDPYWSAVWVKPLSLAVCAAPFMPHWEHIAYWGDKRKSDGGWGGDVLSANVEFGKHRFGHPTPKPMALLRDLVGRTEGTMLDPFAGSGTTLKAALELGRQCIGIEIEERFCEAIVDRLEGTIRTADAEQRAMAL